MPYLYLTCAFVLNGVANILLKLGSHQGLVLASKNPVTLLAANWQFALGCLIFAANVLFYFLALRTLPISIAYPIMIVMSFIIINGYAYAVLSESITWLQLLGYGLIIAGLVLVVTQARV